MRFVLSRSIAIGISLVLWRCLARWSVLQMKQSLVPCIYGGHNLLCWKRFHFLVENLRLHFGIIFPKAARIGGSSALDLLLCIQYISKQFCFGCGNVMDYRRSCSSSFFEQSVSNSISKLLGCAGYFVCHGYLYQRGVYSSHHVISEQLVIMIPPVKLLLKRHQLCNKFSKKLYFGAKGPFISFLVESKTGTLEISLLFL